MCSISSSKATAAKSRSRDRRRDGVAVGRGGLAVPRRRSGHALTAEFSAPSAGPPPWFVYRLTPRAATALATVGSGARHAGGSEARTSAEPRRYTHRHRAVRSARDSNYVFFSDGWMSAVNRDGTPAARPPTGVLRAFDASGRRSSDSLRVRDQRFASVSWCSSRLATHARPNGSPRSSSGRGGRIRVAGRLRPATAHGCATAGQHGNASSVVPPEAGDDVITAGSEFHRTSANNDRRRSWVSRGIGGRSLTGWPSGRRSSRSPSRSGNRLTGSPVILQNA